MNKICPKHNEVMTGNKLRCKSCNREYQKKWRLQNIDIQRQRVRENNKRLKMRNMEYVCNILSKSGCVICGESDPVVLDFDHITGFIKEDTISNLIKRNASIENIQLEIDKCQILCANCHRRKTAQDFNWFKLKFT